MLCRAAAVGVLGPLGAALASTPASPLVPHGAPALPLPAPPLPVPPSLGGLGLGLPPASTLVVDWAAAVLMGRSLGPALIPTLPLKQSSQVC